MLIQIQPTTYYLPRIYPQLNYILHILLPIVLFFDSRLGVGGPTPGVPEYKMIGVPDEAVYPDSYDRKGFEAKQDELINKFILKQYLLKRPELKKEGSDEIYLPYYKCSYNSREVFINAATGKKNL